MTEPKEPRLTLWLVVVVGGLMATQFLAGKPELRTKPGESRGDLVLTIDALPAEIAGWQRREFEPAPKPDELPEGQYWWVHSWVFENAQQTSALVTLDQLGLDHWHELTQCYQGNGWQLTEREIHADADDAFGDHWEYVVARFERNGRKAILVFSTFFEDGEGTTAFRMGIDHQWEPNLDLTLGERIQQRIQAEVSDNDQNSVRRRAIQTQVFVPNYQPDTADSDQQAIQLHLATRSLFRREWLTARPLKM